MKNENALSIERQLSPEEQAKIIAAISHCDFTDQERDMAQQMRNFGKANVVTVTQDINQFTRPE